MAEASLKQAVPMHVHHGKTLSTCPAVSAPCWHPHLWHPFTQAHQAEPPLRAIRGQGAVLVTDNGVHLIDAISSWWVTLHGHGDPTLAAAIAAQASTLEQVIFANFSHPQAERLADRLSEASGLERLFFSDNGSTAVEVALKMAWQWWHNQGEHRQQLIAFEGAYHGDTVGAMAVGARSLFSAPFEPLMFEVARAPWPATWMHDAEVEAKEAQCLEALERLVATPTAAVIVEPLLQGAGGMACVRPQFLSQLEDCVRRSGALLIADEVLTGFGRTGSLFAFQQAEIQPDLVALSKGLTGGFLPMGVTLAREAIYQGFLSEDPGRTFWHGHSFTANPLGCAAANASLDLLEQHPERYRLMANRHQGHLETLAEHPLVQRHRLLGTMAAFDLKTNQPGYLHPAGKMLQAKARDHGVFLRPLGSVVYLLPPLCISDEQLEQCYGALKASLDSLLNQP